LRVLCGSLGKAKRDLVPVCSNSQADNNLFFGKVFSVNKEGQYLVMFDGSGLKLLQFFFSTFYKGAGNRTFRQSKSFIEEPRGKPRGFFDPIGI